MIFGSKVRLFRRSTELWFAWAGRRHDGLKAPLQLKLASIVSDSRKGVLSASTAKEDLKKPLDSYWLSYKGRLNNCLKQDFTHFRWQKFGKMNPIVMNEHKGSLGISNSSPMHLFHGYKKESGF